jgi:hypothetical protein
MKFSLKLFKQPYRQSKYTLYRSLETLPIWNWYRLHQKHDINYLIVLKDYTKKIEIHNDLMQELNNIYDKLNTDFDLLRIKIIKAKEVYQTGIYELFRKLGRDGDIFEDKEQSDVTYKLLIKLAESSNADINWLYKLPLKNEELKRFIPEITRALIEYRTLKENPDLEQSLKDKISIINKELNRNISEMTCSVRKFMEYQLQYIEKINLKNKIVF